MTKPKRQPTHRTIQRMVTRLQAALAVVYADEGRHEAQRTNEHGTLTVSWQSGRSIRAEGVKAAYRCPTCKDTGKVLWRDEYARRNDPRRVVSIDCPNPIHGQGLRSLLAEHEG